MKPLLINITGPTASGKTDLAVALARALDTEIISADSRQVYREMRIGTAVPGPEERQGIPHHLLQHISIHDPYTVKDFEEEALTVLNDIFRRRPVAVMAGGTGLYFHAVNNGLDEIPDIPPDWRRQLTSEWKSRGLAPLLDELQRADPVYFTRVDHRNPVRIIRALEVIRHTGRPFSSFHTGKSVPRPFRSLWIGLTPGRPALYERINRRVEVMDSMGWEDEARALYQYRHLNALQTVGYREWFPYFEGHISRRKALNDIAKNTRRYAKRQCTWFRKNPRIRWFDPAQRHKILNFVAEHLK